MNVKTIWQLTAFIYALFIFTIESFCQTVALNLQKIDDNLYMISGVGGN